MSNTLLRQRGLLGISLSLMLILLQTWQPELYFQRQLIQNGEIWRLWTGNLVHTNIWHLALNLGGWGLCLLLAPQRLSTAYLMLSIAVLMSVVGLGLYSVNANLLWYAGFSGVLYGLFTLAGIYWLLERDYVLGLMLLLFSGGKAFSDLALGGDSLSSQLIAAPVIYAAHIYGIIGAVGLALPQIIRSWQHAIPKPT
jgi:rhomboid family GlyGly-CTERM serine protease